MARAVDKAVVRGVAREVAREVGKAVVKGVARAVAREEAKAVAHLPLPVLRPQ